MTLMQHSQNMLVFPLEATIQGVQRYKGYKGTRDFLNALFYKEAFKKRYIRILITLPSCNSLSLSKQCMHLCVFLYRLAKTLSPVDDQCWLKPMFFSSSQCAQPMLHNHS